MAERNRHSRSRQHDDNGRRSKRDTKHLRKRHTERTPAERSKSVREQPGRTAPGKSARQKRTEGKSAGTKTKSSESPTEPKAGGSKSPVHKGTRGWWENILFHKKPEKAEKVEKMEKMEKAIREDPDKASPVKRPELIYERPFFYGYMPREDVEIVLLHPGEFVVRRTGHATSGNSSGFCISVMWKDAIHHIIIRWCKDEDGELQYSIESPWFKTIDELVHFYHSTQKPVWKKSDIKLIVPLQRADWVLHDAQLSPVKLLGAGNYGEVWECLFRRFAHDTPQKVAVKCLKGHKIPKSESSAFFGECRRLRNLCHPNLVTFIGMTIDTKPPKMVMELCDISLTTYLTKRKGKINWRGKAVICLQVARGMEYLRKENLIHRDLAARNCLLKEGVVKIADLGMAREGKLYTMEKSKPLPLKWTPPEAIRHLTFNEATDVWSFGVLMWEVFTDAGNPYDALDEKDSEDYCAVLLEFLDAGNRLEAPPETPRELSETMVNCMNKTPEDRPTFSSICKKLTDYVQAHQNQAIDL